MYSAYRLTTTDGVLRYCMYVQVHTHTKKGREVIRTPQVPRTKKSHTKSGSVQT